MDLRTKRAYDPPSRADGCRILIDRMWPRGVSKEAARIDLWARDVAPSTELRKWYGHDPERWDEFRRRFAAELDAQPAAVEAIRERLAAGRVTLVYAAKDAEHCNAAALAGYLKKRRARHA